MEGWGDSVSSLLRVATGCGESGVIAPQGSRVIVTGRLRQRSFETAEGGKQKLIEVEVDEIGPSLRYAVAKVTKTSHGKDHEQQPAAASPT